MGTFHCWSLADLGHDEDDGKLIEADAPQDAAETYAEKIFNQGDSPFQEIIIYVRTNETTVEIFNVEVRYSASFWAHKKRELKSNLEPDRDTPRNLSEENPDAQDDLPPVLGETEAVPTVREPQGG